MRVSFFKIGLAGFIVLVPLKFADPLMTSIEKASALAAEAAEAASEMASGNDADKAGEEAAKPAAAEKVCRPTEEAAMVIAREKKALREREERIDEREARLRLAEGRIETEMKALRELKTAVEKVVAETEKRSDDDLAQVVAIYRDMKPKQAASVFDTMDVQFVVEIMSAMESRTSSPILAAMSPLRANAVTKIILERSKLPGDQKLPPFLKQR